MTQQQHWDLINSTDPRIWNIAKHRSADALVDMSIKWNYDRQELANTFQHLSKKTGDLYYLELSKRLLQ